MFESLDLAIQASYREQFLTFARRANAAFVLLVSEGVDWFEDHFLDIDGKRVLHQHMSNGEPIEVDAVWIDAARALEIPVGVVAEPLGELCGFRRHNPEGWVRRLDF